MTVAELIERLKEMPQDAKVYYNDSDYFEQYIDTVKFDKESGVELG